MEAGHEESALGSMNRTNFMMDVGSIVGQSKYK